MAKRNKKRQAGRSSLPSQRPQPAPVDTVVPSAQTLYRVKLIDRQTHALLRKATSALKPVLWLRDRERVALIKQAGTAEALIELAPVATGLAETAWEDRMRRLGPEVIPLIVERLSNLRVIQDTTAREITLEKLVADLRWRGDAGAEALLACFDALDDYGRSLASMVLGLLGAQASADRLWSFYRNVERNQRETYFVGALWGLIDLKDERAGGALVDLLRRRRTFQELFGFLALAGDARALIPLMETIVRAREEDRYEPAMALTGISHRIGRDALLVELDKIVPVGESPVEREAMADKILSRPPSAVEEYFAIFYRGLTPEDMAQAPGR